MNFIYFEFEFVKKIFFIQVFKELLSAYSENTDQLDRTSFSLYVHPALHLTNLLPVDIQCAIDVNQRFY